MKTAILAFALIAGSAILPISAQEEKAASTRLLEILKFKETAMSAANTMFAPAIQNMKAQGLQQEAIDEISAAANSFFLTTYENPELAKEIAQVYADSYSEEEIEELILFYQTALGQKTLATMPQVMKQASGIGQKYAVQNQQTFQQEIQGIMAKYKKPEKVEEKPAPAPAPAPAE